MKKSRDSSGTCGNRQAWKPWPLAAPSSTGLCHVLSQSFYRTFSPGPASEPPMKLQARKPQREPLFLCTWPGGWRDSASSEADPA